MDQRPETWLLPDWFDDERARDHPFHPSRLLSDFLFQMTIRRARIKPLRASGMGFFAFITNRAPRPSLLTLSWLQLRLARTKRTALSTAQTVAPVVVHTISMLADGLPSLRPITLPSRQSCYFPFLPLVDVTVLSWFHLKVCAVAGAGFFTDA